MAVVSTIAERDVRLPMPVMAVADEAAVEIARFDAEPGAEVAPFAALLLRSESASSSRIENLTSGARAIALAELEHGDRSNAVEIVANVHAMQAAIRLADRLDTEAVLARSSPHWTTSRTAPAGDASQAACEPALCTLREDLGHYPER